MQYAACGLITGNTITDTVNGKSVTVCMDDYTCTERLQAELDDLHRRMALQQEVIRGFYKRVDEARAKFRQKATERGAK